jgi:hypothetical protein
LLTHTGNETSLRFYSCDSSRIHCVYATGGTRASRQLHTSTAVRGPSPATAAELGQVGGVRFAPSDEERGTRKNGPMCEKMLSFRWRHVSCSGARARRGNGRRRGQAAAQGGGQRRPRFAVGCSRTRAFFLLVSRQKNKFICYLNGRISVMSFNF